MAQPDLSICIPTYNRAAILKDTLAHLEFLNDFPFTAEVVISDNASPDDTADVVRAAESRIPNLRYVRQDTNIGPTGNIGSAFRMAEGRYATYLADDDRFVPDTPFNNLLAGPIAFKLGLPSDPNLVRMGGDRMGRILSQRSHQP